MYPRFGALSPAFPKGCIVSFSFLPQAGGKDALQQRNREQDKALAKIDGYELFVRNGAYYVRFSDSNHVVQEAKVTKNQFVAFLKSVAQAKKEKNEQDRHIEQSELTEATLQRRMANKPSPLEDQLHTEMEHARLRRAINGLPEVLRRRLELHYDQKLTFEQIAMIEGVTNQAISKSIRLAIEKLRIALMR